MRKSWRAMIGSTAPTCTYNECKGCKYKCRAEQVPVEGNDPINSPYHYRCVCHRWLKHWFLVQGCNLLFRQIKQIFVYLHSSTISTIFISFLSFPYIFSIKSSKRYTFIPFNHGCVIIYIRDVWLMV